jgi:uncharacterized membrane protein (UPF0182 family)
MEPTLGESLKAVFGTVPEAQGKTVPAPPQLEELSRAREILNKAEEAIRKGNWEDFGKAMDELQGVLKEQPAKKNP